ncbi:MarC family protein [Phaeobacter marinintestinus]|uniref:MarC family protein n=1 Tax=Falsiphaeobacter marinintestinus TaxID=1492905 RepID=UPI0011B76685|nr:MarC family protein [Phaeobacter marinintestinus]
MTVSWPEYVQIFVGIFALVSPPVIVPMFLGLVGGRTLADKKTAANVGALGFFVATSLFVFAGQTILTAFGIELSAFQAAGGFLLLLIALDMLRSEPDEGNQGEARASSIIALGIVPLTIPVLAGPGVLSAVVLFSTEFSGVTHKLFMVGIMALVSASVFLTLRVALASDRLFTPNVTLIFNKVMGLMIAAIAFEFMFDGIAAHFPMLSTVPN